MAADTAENSWLDRFAELDYDTLLDEVEDERPDLNTESKRVQYLENIYGEEAAVLGAEVADIRAKLADYEESDFRLDTATDADVTFKDVTDDAEYVINYQKWLAIGTIYEGLKDFEGGNFAKGELLDFFMEENDPEDTEIFIPMAAALSEGQRSGLPFVSFERLMSYAFTNDEGWKKFAQQSKTAFDGLTEVSVYQNIDRGLYADDGSVALTDAAQRADNTAEGTTGSEEEQIDTLGKIMFVSWAATVSGRRDTESNPLPSSKRWMT
jgi:hypothetical protein